MPRELFRIKATERRDNMQDIQGLLNQQKVNSAWKTMLTTIEIYIPKARELGLDTLADQLIEDRRREHAAFIEARLITPIEN